MSTQVRTDVKGLERFVFADGADPDKLHLHISEIEPATSAHAPHQHDGQEIFYVLSGEGEVIVGEEKHCIAAGQAIQVDGRVLHGLRNVGDSPMRYAVIIAKP